MSDPSPNSLQETQACFEQRFSCVICFSARFEMVSGQCQHRVCTECLYDKNNVLKKLFNKCPVCQFRYSFPNERPDIPEDNKEMMRCLGVRSCPNQDKGCAAQMWVWEQEDHVASCEWKPAPLPKRKRSTRTSDSETSKPASALRRATRSHKRKKPNYSHISL